MRRALAKPGDRLEVHIKASVIAIQFIRPPPPRDPSAGKGHVFGPSDRKDYDPRRPFPVSIALTPH